MRDLGEIHREIENLTNLNSDPHNKGGTGESHSVEQKELDE